MPVSQTVLIDTYDYGASLTSATIRNADTDVLVATAASANEVTADGGLYAVVFTDATTVIPAGTYRVRGIVAGAPIARYVTLTGVDGEIATGRSERAAELDSATQASIDAIEADTNELQTNQGAWATATGFATPTNITAATGITVSSIGANVVNASALAADAVTEIQSGLATAANLLIVSDGVGFITSVLLGTISDAGTAGETYVVTFGGATYTLDYTGLDATGNRTGVTRTKV